MDQQSSNENNSTLTKVLAIAFTCSLIAFMIGFQLAKSSAPEPEGNQASISTVTDEAPLKSLYNLAEEYPKLSAEDNIYIVADAESAFNFLEHGTGILFLGYPECPWCQDYVPLLQDMAKEHGINKIVYYDVRKSRLDDPDSYAKLLSLLDEHGDFTEYNEDGEKRIFVPFTALLDHGKVTFSDNDTSHLNSDEISPEEYWSENDASEFKQKFDEPLKNTKDAMDKCQDCSE